MDATVMAALIGAAASLIVTALSTVGIEAYKRFHEGRAMAAALAGELSSYAKAHELALTALPALAEDTREKLPKPPPHGDLVFDAYVPRLGLLGIEILEELVLVYHKTKTYRGLFDLACDAQQPQRSALINGGVDLIRDVQNRSGPLIELLRKRSRSGVIATFWGRARSML